MADKVYKSKNFAFPLPYRIFTPGVEEGKTYPAFVLAPKCARKVEWLNHNSPKKPFGSYNWKSIPESRMMKITIALIDYLAEICPVDRNRLYITGPSMGGSGTWDMITRYPDLFAAAPN